MFLKKQRGKTEKKKPRSTGPPKRHRFEGRGGEKKGSLKRRLKKKTKNTTGEKRKPRADSLPGRRKEKKKTKEQLRTIACTGKAGKNVKM